MGITKVSNSKSDLKWWCYGEY